MLSNKTKISLIGSGMIGGTLAYLLQQKGCYDVVMLDVHENIAKGKSLDIAHCSPMIGVGGCMRSSGGHGYEIIKDSDICIITAGIPRAPGMSRDDLVSTNTKVIADIAEKISFFCPEAICICVTNPVDAMTCILQRVSKIARERVIGMAGELDLSRFRYFLSQSISVDPSSIHAVVLGGHGDLMVFPGEYISIEGLPVDLLVKKEQLEQVIQRTRYAGGEINNLLLKGSAFYAPATAVYRMIESIVFNLNRLMCCSVYSEEHGVYVGYPVFLSAEGVNRILNIPLSQKDRGDFYQSVNSIKSVLDLCGQFI